eukprot:8423926-Alexandrium_andersonii.AAC.1
MLPMASLIAMSFACALGRGCWRSVKTQPALCSRAAEFMITPKAGRSRGPNLGSATRLCLAQVPGGGR